MQYYLRFKTQDCTADLLHNAPIARLDDAHAGALHNSNAADKKSPA